MRWISLDVLSFQGDNGKAEEIGESFLRDSCGNKNGRDPFLRNEDFVAFYRGRPDASAAPLDKSQIETLAIQIASNFTQTSGPFQLELQSIAGLKSEAVTLV